VLAVSFGIGSLLSIPIVATTSSWITKPTDVFLVVYLGLATTGLAYIFFGNGISHLSPGTVSTMTLAEPVLATIWGVFLLSEPMGLRGWVGAGIILIALLYLGIAESRNPKGSKTEKVATNA
jgi:DME family drug/metabolite transporter